MRKMFMSMGLAILVPLCLNAIKPLEAGVNEYIAIMEASGNRMYSFDVSDLSDTARTVFIEVREYSGDTLAAPTIKFPLKTVDYRDRDDMIMAGFDDADFENVNKSIFWTLKRINIGFRCVPNDSVATIVIDVPDNMRAPITRNLRQIKDGKGDSRYFYAPFACTDFSAVKSGEFTPLAVLASGWFDAKINNLRACGNGNTVTENSPHYFVVGLKVKNDNIRTAM